MVDFPERVLKAGWKLYSAEMCP